MRCCFSACELWKLARRGYVPMDIYNAGRSSSNCGCGCNCNCGCGDYYEEASTGCGCSENTVRETGCCNG